MKLTLRPLLPNENKNNPEYASEDCQLLLKMYDDFYPDIGFHMPWIAYLILKENTVVGTCSFVGKPHEGKVEIAYWTFTAYEGQGIASFACSQLISIAWQTDAELILTAKTAPEKNASTRILEKTQFHRNGIVQDHEIGDAWLWELVPKSE